jgi:hypothetical protein
MKKLIIAVFIFLSSVCLSIEPPVDQKVFAISGLWRLFLEKIKAITPTDNTLHEQIDYSDEQELSFIKENNPSTHLRFPSIEHNFAFTNTTDDLIDSYQRDFGICRGYSSARRKFRYYGIFDKKNKSKTVIPERSSNRKYVKFFRKIVASIRKNKFTLIPGFSNLHEFSNDPQIMPMMKWELLREWRDKNFDVNSGTLEILKGTYRRSTYAELLLMRQNIKQNFELGHNSLIWLSAKITKDPLDTWIHVVEAIDASKIESDGSFSITFWNDKFTALNHSTSQVHISADGSIIYRDATDAGDRPLISMGITKDNDGEIKFYAKQVAKLPTKQIYLP